MNNESPEWEAWITRYNMGCVAAKNRFSESQIPCLWVVAPDSRDFWCSWDKLILVICKIRKIRTIKNSSPCMMPFKHLLNIRIAVPPVYLHLLSSKSIFNTKESGMWLWSHCIQKPNDEINVKKLRPLYWHVLSSESKDQTKKVLLQCEPISTFWVPRLVFRFLRCILLI